MSTKSSILSGLPLAEVRKLIRAMTALGLSPEAVAAEVAQLLDEAVDFRAKLRGPLGEAAEKIDGEVFRVLTRALAELLVQTL